MDEFVKPILMKLKIDESDIDSVLKQLKPQGNKSDKLLSELRNIQQHAITKLTSIFDNALKTLKSTINDGIARLSSMTEYSKMTDSNVRELKLGYGFSSSQAYGYQQALDVMGFTSMEDLMWADSQQLELFRQSFDKYTTYYQETMTPEYVAKQMEYQAAMAQFKIDLEHSVVTFFMNNQDTIMALMDFSMIFMQTVMTLLADMVETFNLRERSSTSRTRETQSILSSYTANNRNTNITQSNTFNNVSQADQTWLQNSSQFALKQVIESYERG